MRLSQTTALAALMLAAAGTAGAETIRIASFNASLNRNDAGQLFDDLTAVTPADAAQAARIRQIQQVAEIIQRVNPDILLINEFDPQNNDSSGLNTQAFNDNFLNSPQDTIGQGPAPAVDYAYQFTAPSNTGVPSGVDLDGSGPGGFPPNDAFGFGFFPASSA